MSTKSRSAKTLKQRKKTKATKAPKASKNKKPLKPKTAARPKAKAKAKPAVKRFNKKDLEYYKNLLLDVKENLVRDIRSMAGNSNSAEAESRDLSGHVQHMADVATDMYDKEFNTNLASKDREVIVKIDDALKRIEDGTYGICLATGKPIAKARLKAIPYAEYCLEHQEELEKRPSQI